MDQNNYYDRKVREFDKAERRKERKEKWAKRERSFWKAFLFTENGKPKSSLLIYTFSLSFVFFAVYVGALFLLVDWLNPVVESWPPVAGNLLEAGLSCAIGILVGMVLHELFPDKRLVFGAHIWLALYAVAAFITVLLMMKGDAGVADFTAFFCWFFLPPVVLGNLVFYYLFRRDYEPERKPQELKPWQKYTRR